MSTGLEHGSCGLSANTLTFADTGTSVVTLQVWNWTGTERTAGTHLTDDRLRPPDMQGKSVSHWMGFLLVGVQALADPVRRWRLKAIHQRALRVIHFPTNSRAVLMRSGCLRLVFTANTGSLNLSMVNFYSDGGTSFPGGGGAVFVSGNELVPVPEPGAPMSVAALLGAVGFSGRRAAALRRLRAEG